MDNEDFGIKNPPFQRYIPSCYGKYQRYIPSVYMEGDVGLSEKEEGEVDTWQLSDLKRIKSSV